MKHRYPKPVIAFLSLFFVYIVFTILFFTGYLMVWFIEYKQPSLNPAEWKEIERLLLFIYAVIIPPVASFAVVYKQIIENMGLK
ncbi:MAG: hypothetical protein HRS57_02155 [Mycoplasmataceae bacterium]|nr:hypothetical protein [Mycoplasmataceae bacterium]